VQALLQSGKIQMGHARALVSLEHDDCLELGQACAAEEMTVRELEKAVRARLAGGKRPKGRPKGGSPGRRDPVIESFEEKLRHRFATAVDIRRKRDGGSIEIEFYDDGDLERILELLLGDAD
jgi:ParB family chromosome partitioning protein